MAGKMYYLTTLAAWQRHAHRFAGSHWIALSDSVPSALAPPPPDRDFSADGALPAASYRVRRLDAALASPAPVAPQAELPGAGNPPLQVPGFALANYGLSDATPILVLIDADEGAHVVLESDADFQPLPHPLAQKAIPAAAQSAISASGIALPDRATTFEAAESLARVHPLLRHRVY